LINDSKNSANLQSSENRITARELIVVIALALLTIGIASAWFVYHDYILYYGDAQSHLNISRGIIDSRTPGYEQIGSVWLPLLHIICVPFVANDTLWSTGLAGTIPVAACFVIAVVFFYLAAREAYGSVLPAVVTIACFALNPNVLYLSSIPMTETVFFAALSIQLFALLRFRRTQARSLIVFAGIASICASMTRYDGWFLIPFVALGFLSLAREHRFRAAVLFSFIAALAPLYWIAHNQWATGDALSFYRGPYSAKGIYLRGLAEGNPRDPVDHNLHLSLLYYFTAGRFCSGWPLILIGAAGIAAAVWARRWIPVLFLLLTPCFYIWTMYSTGQPIHIPNLWPFSYYNTRYGLAVVPLCAFGAGALVLTIPHRWRKCALALPVIAVSVWLVNPAKENWICWRESKFNSDSRRFWTEEVAAFFKANYRRGDGILFGDGDVPGVFCRARLPLAEGLTQGNGPAYLANGYQPARVPLSKWAVVLEADRDPLAATIGAPGYADEEIRYHSNRRIRDVAYMPVLEIHTKYDPVVRVYRRIR
jgi:hypothetical protein